MHYLNRLFGYQKEKVPYPQFNYRIKLLNRLHRASPENIFNGNDFVEKKYSELLGNIETEVKTFINSGFIKKSEFKDNLKNEFTVKELKEVLRSKKIKLTGRKNELVERIIENFSQSELESEKAYVQKYSLTEIGSETVKQDKLRFSKEHFDFENFIFNLLYNYKFEKAFKYVAKFYASYPLPLAMCDWNRGFHFVDKEITKGLRDFDFDFCESNASKNITEQIRTSLATYSLFKYDYLCKFKIEERIEKILPDFQCQLIEKFISNAPTGLFQHYKNPSNKKKLEMFVHYSFNIAYNTAKMKDIKRLENRSWCKGVTILQNRKDCSYCINSENQNFGWSEQHKIPILPKFPGCTCSYLPWIDR